MAKMAPGIRRIPRAGPDHSAQHPRVPPSELRHTRWRISCQTKP
jgi:hypothetical protein